MTHVFTRPLTDDELEAAGIEPAPIAHETFTQVFAVDDGKLEIVDEHDDTTPTSAPDPARVGPAVWAWVITAVGAVILAAEVAL